MLQYTTFRSMEHYTERINLPLSPEMYAAIKDRAVSEGNSAVALIRKFIIDGLAQTSKVVQVEKRVEEIQSQHAPKMHDLEARVEYLERSLERYFDRPYAHELPHRRLIRRPSDL